jgi:copper chaperone CopZ
MLLITEYTNETQTVIEEGKNGKKELFIEGVFTQAEKKNRNGRIYRNEVLDREMNRYIKEYVSTNRALGELNHPQSPSVNPERACHLTVEMKKSGNDWIGKSKVLDTPMGNIVRALIEGGAQMGVSTRGLGSIKNVGGVNEVQSDFKLICVDVVSDPSGIDCWVDGIMEGVNFNADGKIVESAKKQILIAPKRRLEEVKLQQFEKFIQEISRV